MKLQFFACHPALWIAVACLGCSDAGQVRAVPSGRGAAMDTSSNPASGNERDGAVLDGSTVAAADAAVLPPDAQADAGCMPGATRCASENRRVEICIGDDRWVDKEGCPSTCSEGMCTGSCIEGQRRCGKHQAPQVCNRAGDWSPEASCPFICSGDGLCAGECKPGDKRCSGSDNRTPQTCGDDGTWSAASACPYFCSSGSCMGSCQPGARRCGADATPEQCSAMGSWQSQQACPFLCSGQGECSGECRPGDGGCDQNTPRSCDVTGHWNSGTACSGRACVDGECVGECEPGDQTCHGNALGTCDAMGMYQDDACPKLCSGDHCVDCVHDSDCADDALCQDNSCVEIKCFGPPINGQGNGAACCDSRCGVPPFDSSPDMGCGQSMCGDSVAGPEGCCTGTIRTQGKSCKETGSAPCWLQR